MLGGLPDIAIFAEAFVKHIPDLFPLYPNEDPCFQLNSTPGISSEGTKCPTIILGY